MPKKGKINYKYKEWFRKRVGVQRSRYPQGIISLHHTHIGHKVTLRFDNGETIEKVVGGRRGVLREEYGHYRVSQGYIILPKEYIGRWVEIKDDEYSLGNINAD